MSPAEKRRKKIVELLKHSDRPITGAYLSEMFDVSRQIIVKDISHLKTQNYPIHSTSKGYFFNDKPHGRPFKRVIMCEHDDTQIEKELTTIVENGAMIDNVSVEHPIYGTIQAELMIESIENIQSFVEDMAKYQGTMLAELTGLIHLHTISADSEKILDNAVRDLQQQGFIVDVQSY
ncbi:transcription repressor NadR [Staphylococcus coagulans]|uniref:transcription repressor NadR n=1 Tax=Staphylococcus coagulans TaxID=74706 RepID=UPI0015FA55E8|nr:transcription repressor NadR [Staphylococcus coagulans]MBA8762563.1 HTH domain-containing protein [Staphylococcus coagulans]